MFQDKRNKEMTLEDLLAHMNRPSRLEISLATLSPDEIARQFRPEDADIVEELHIVGTISREQVNELLTKLPPFKNVEWILVSEALVSNLTLYEPAWWGVIKPEEDPVRFALAATLLDRERFPKLEHVNAGDGGWAVKDGWLYNPYRTYEPGIDFL